MKYLFFILLFVVASIQTEAQKIWAFNGSDTITDAATVNLKLTVTQGYNNAVFQVINTRLSGTSAGTSILQGSLDDTNYVAIDTITHTNVAVSTGVFTLSPPTYPYYRVVSTGSGTMSVITKCLAHFKKY